MQDRIVLPEGSLQSCNLPAAVVHRSPDPVVLYPFVPPEFTGLHCPRRGSWHGLCERIVGRAFGSGQMRIAVPDWKGRVSPVFDVARQVLVVDLDTGRESGRTIQSLVHTLLPLKADELARQGVNVLLCGGISAPLLRMLQARGIQVIPGISGDVGQVLRGYLAGRLTDSRFALPGWRGPGGRRHRGGRGGW